MSIDLDLLKKLTQSYGPSGNEKNVLEHIKEEAKNYCDEIYFDNIGNMICKKNGGGKKIMITAHSDELGLLITHIDENGFLRFVPIGSIKVENCLYKRVEFYNGFNGIVGIEHLDDKKDIKFDNLYIDIGAESREDAEKFVKVGDSAVFKGEFFTNGSRIFSKAIDDRIGCYVALETLKDIKTVNELYFVFTVQEEVGARGATTAAYNIEPDLSISVDVTSTGDTPKSKNTVVSLGKGAAIKVKDRSIIVNPKIKEFMVDIAKKYSIPYQMEILELGGTDAGSIHMTKGGIPSGVISIPTRYVHSISEEIDINDVNASIELLKRVIEN
ncbi:M42 family metallopeptidase [Thermoanaerobacterium sp. RBIITD]|uniref:M42 family metallopeptidase n=1 Tax=Thermoanaerobacterium sp. RBIITD TaxID=1550240 RepID=UPI000BB6E8FD|nr:M42 family metallopeptidase [Thermoanaerobacterium sp. RBIITD]SNX55430.1 endoglucanase [Thermoanaerobacterium sp. RBIITD]